MIEIIFDPPSILIDGEPVTNFKVNPRCESEMEVGFEELKATRVKDYPDLLITDIASITSSKVPLVGRYQIYKASSAFHFNIFFEHNQGEWRGNLSLRSLYREIIELANTKYKSYNVAHSTYDGWLYITFPFFECEELITSEIQKFLNVANELLLDAEARLKGFTWNDSYNTNETLFTKEFLVPLITKLGFDNVRYTGGPYEYGKDIVFSEIDRFNNFRYSAAQVKAGNISGASGLLMDKILAQINDTFSMPFQGAGPQKNYYISELLIICSGQFTSNAIQKINSKMPKSLKGSVHFMDRDDVIWLAKKNWPF